jgi:hypothetical protein
MIITTSKKTNGFANGLPEIFRYLMLIGFDENRGKIVGKKVTSLKFKRGETKMLKTVLMYGRYYLLEHVEDGSHALIHRFTENEIVLEMAIPVSEPFSAHNGYFIVGAGKYDRNSEMTIFACGTKRDNDACYFVLHGNFKRTSLRPSFSYNFGNLMLNNRIEAITTLDQYFVRKNLRI